jgi:RNA recognition motif-containing protein
MNIYVGNLSPEISIEELRQEFLLFGEVVSIVIMNDNYIGSGQARAYGYVEMASESQGRSAIGGLNGKRLKGRVVNVVQALPLSSRSCPEFRPRAARWASLKPRERG